MSIQLLLCDLVPSGVFKIISDYCGNTELNVSIEKFDKHKLKNTKINIWDNIKLCYVYIINNQCYYRNVMLQFSTPYFPAIMLPQYYNYTNCINIKIGLNTLKFHESMPEFSNYLDLIKYEGFLKFMLNFENTMCEKIVKNNDLTKFNLVPFVKSNKILFCDEDSGEYNEKIIMGYTYSIEIILTSNTKYYKYDPLNNNVYETTYKNIIKKYGHKIRFVLEPFIKIHTDTNKIYVHLIVNQLYQM